MPDPESRGLSLFLGSLLIIQSANRKVCLWIRWKENSFLIINHTSIRGCEYCRLITMYKLKLQYLSVMMRVNCWLSMKSSKFLRCMVIMMQMLQWVHSLNQQLLYGPGAGLVSLYVTAEGGKASPPFLVLESVKHHQHSSRDIHLRILQLFYWLNLLI